jgi:cell division protein DivIC
MAIPKPGLKKLVTLARNKYVLTLVIFLVWILLFDSNNLIDRYKYIRDLKQFRKDKEYYIQQIEIDKKKLQELKTDTKNLEKFAREEYYMKKDNEDIFLIVEDE